MLGMGRECTNLRLHLLFSLIRFYKRSRNQRPDRSLLAFARADLDWWLKPYPLQNGLRFFYPPLPAAPSAFLTDRFPRGGDYGLTVFRVNNNNSGLGSASTPTILGGYATP